MWVVLNLPTQQSNHHASIAPWANYDMVAENKNAPANSILLAKGGGGSEEEEEQQKQVQNILVLPCCHSTSPAPAVSDEEQVPKSFHFPVHFLCLISPHPPPTATMLYTQHSLTLYEPYAKEIDFRKDTNSTVYSSQGNCSPNRKYFLWYCSENVASCDTTLRTTTEPHPSTGVAANYPKPA